jgi:aspartate aminotransferase
MKKDNPSLPIVGRVRRIKPSPSTQAAARARELKAQGRDIVDLALGEPDFDTPEPIKQAACAAIARGETKYTPVNGTPRLRDAIRAKLLKRLGATYGANQIVVGCGAKQLIFTALLATVETGVEVIVPAPYWVSYPDMVLACDGTPVIVRCGEETGFKLTAAALESAITPHTRWLILNSPSNPTGASYTKDELRALADVLIRHPEVYVLLDDIYDEIVFDGATPPSLIQVEERLVARTLLLNGVSKTYAMTGWRIGYGAGPAAIAEAINTLISQSTSCPSSISQAAAVAALEGDQSFVHKALGIYAERRDAAVELLNKIPGFHCIKPQGAFYVFPSCAGVIGKTTPEGKTIANDHDFAMYLIDQGVVVIHGAAYGLSPHIRLSVATGIELVREGCVRIAKAVALLR